MLFSVVIPTFNRQELIGSTLASVMSQELSPGQIIVVDDGGTDDTEDVARRFGVEYVKIQNSGPGNARNIGVSLSRHDWIAFCDSDDLWKPSYLRHFSDILKSESFYGFANWVDVEGSNWTSTAKFSSAPSGFFDDLHNPLYSKLIEFTPIWPSATVVRKDFFSKIGGFNRALSRLPTEDYDFSLRCNEHSPATVMHEPLVGIRKHVGNYSRGRIRQHLSDADILSWACEHHVSGVKFRSKLQKSIVFRRLTAFREAFVIGNFAIMREIARSLSIYDFDWRDLIKLSLAQSRVLPSAWVRLMFGRFEAAE